MKYTSAILKASVANYFRYQRQCPLICFERGLTTYSVPDVLIVTDKRMLIEVEIKVDWTDFLNDQNKRKWYLQEHWKQHVPYQFWYCVSPDLSERCRGWFEENKSKFIQLPGLMTVSECTKNNWNQNMPEVVLVTTAQCNKVSTKLTLKQISILVKHQTGTLCALAAKLAANQIIL